MIIEDPKKSRRAIDLLSDIPRISIYEQKEEYVNLHSELTLNKEYLELEKLRFEERLNYQFIIDSGLDHFKIPTFSILLFL